MAHARSRARCARWRGARQRGGGPRTDTGPERADRNAMVLGGHGGSGRGNHLLRDQREWWRGARVEDRPSAAGAAGPTRLSLWRSAVTLTAAVEETIVFGINANTLEIYNLGRSRLGHVGARLPPRRVLALWLCARPPRLATSSPRAKRSLVSARHLLACLLLHAFATGRPHDRSRAFSLHQGSHVRSTCLPALSSNPLAIVCTLGPRPQSTRHPAAPTCTDRPT